MQTQIRRLHAFRKDYMKLIHIVKSHALILTTTAIFLFGAWGFWKYFQQSAFDLIYIYLIVTLFFENRRLRSLLRKRDEQEGNS